MDSLQKCLRLADPLRFDAGVPLRDREPERDRLPVNRNIVLESKQTSSKSR